MNVPTQGRSPDPTVWRRLGGLVLSVFLVSLCLAPSASAAATEQISGDGSSWAYIAVNQWIQDVSSQGLQVNFTSTGSAQGRTDFANSVVDFAVSDIGYQGHDPLTGANDSSNRPYAYVPIVAGGTSFPYKILEGGKPVTNLRLSGETLSKIFTNQITNWDDPEVTKDNNGHALPDLPIIPVVHSEGAGSTYFFTNYMAKEYPSIWGPYEGGNQGVVPTEYWPRKGNQIADDGSDTLINTINSASGNGTIGYDEYSYALATGLPVANIENSAGYYTLPTQYNVAVALTQAQINMDKGSPDYLLQTLNNVYTYSDPRTYPLSSYSYGIIPIGTSTQPPPPGVTYYAQESINTAKRQTLADYLDYSTCQGQAEVGPIGYSSLPINLVEASFQQVQLLHTADPGVDVSQAQVADCNNPTFIPGDPTKNELAIIAPQPPLCDKAGQGPCGDNTEPNGSPVSTSKGKVVVVVGAGTTGTQTTGGQTKTGTVAAGGAGTTGEGGSSGGGTSSTGGTAGTSSPGGAAATSGSSASSSAGTATSGGGAVNPLTGVASSGGGGTTPLESDAGANYASSTSVAADGNNDPKVLLAVLAIILLLLVLAVPPLGLRLRDRGKR